MPTRGAKVVRRGAAWVQEACDDWNAVFGEATAPGGEIAGSLRRVVERYGWDAVRPAWQLYLRAEPARFVKPGTFASKLGVWLGKKTSGSRDVAAASRELIQRWLDGRREGGAR